MTLEIFKAITPWLLFLISIVQVGMGFFLAYVLKKIDRLEVKRQRDEIKMYEKFVASEAFYMRIGDENRTTAEIFKQLKELNASMNQIKGQLGAADNHG